MPISLTADQKARLNRMCPASALAGGLGSLIDTLDGNTDEANAAKIGTLASLTTTDKTDLVTAINEVLAGTEESTAIGTLASLTTTEKTNLVGALNEVRAALEAQVALVYRYNLSEYTATDLTATVALHTLGVSYGAGTIVRAGMQVAATGADASDALSVELDVTIEAESVFSTKPVIAKAAANGADSLASATGVTPGVLDAAKVAVSNRSYIKYSLTPTRTTPETEISGIRVFVDIAYPLA